LILAGTSVCYVLGIFEDAAARAFAIKAIKIIAIFVVTSLIIIFMNNIGSSNSDKEKR